ncbi:RING-H2 finger protein ATL3-like [Gastrolobium bilobum]|uniref:RING-H2 finger protein ATL3-like n=1 Tax=Gastrolobium bilobum TaxID=150636 RepID=UPI002AB2375B|nr:RING-H2 finger protein ATL3-like [Gastrolobium bilobum]
MSDSSVPSDNLGESPAVDITGKIMVVVIIILFMVVVISMFFHLYAKRFWWSIGETTAFGSRSRSRNGRRFVFASGQDGAFRTGLDPSVLRSLPVLLFQSQDFKDGLECAVCLSELVQGEKARLLPECNHGFHADCIDMWFQSHSTCPLCRKPVASESVIGSNDEQNVSRNNGSTDAENSAYVSGLESSTFPTNVLIWGNQTQISSTVASLEESTSRPPCSSSSSGDSSSNNKRHGMLVIDIPTDITSSSLSPSSSRFAEDDLKSPMTGRLRALKRLLSRDNKLNPWSPNSIDVEQAGGGQS